MTVLMTPMIKLKRSFALFRDELIDVLENLDADEAPYAVECLDSASKDLESVRLWIGQATKSIASIKSRS